MSHGGGGGGDGDERPTKYILEGHTPVPCHDLMTWARWYEENYLKRHVARSRIRGVLISTVFLAIDHSWSGPPILFETMTFGARFSQRLWRYQTWTEAEAGHKEIHAQVHQATRRRGGYQMRRCDAVKRNRRQNKKFPT